MDRVSSLPWMDMPLSDTLSSNDHRSLHMFDLVCNR